MFQFYSYNNFRQIFMIEFTLAHRFTRARKCCFFAHVQLKDTVQSRHARSFETTCASMEPFFETFGFQASQDLHRRPWCCCSFRRANVQLANISVIHAVGLSDAFDSTTNKSKRNRWECIWMYLLYSSNCANLTPDWSRKKCSRCFTLNVSSYVRWLQRVSKFVIFLVFFAFYVSVYPYIDI